MDVQLWEVVKLKIRKHAFLGIFSVTTLKTDSESKIQMRMSIILFLYFFLKIFDKYF